MVFCSVQTDRQRGSGETEKRKIEEISGECGGEFIGTAVACRCFKTGQTGNEDPSKFHVYHSGRF